MSVRFGAFTLDPARRQLSRDGGEIHLTPKAFDLLSLLVGEAPRVVRKNELHERLWPGTFVSDATLVGLVKELRRALDDHDAAAPIVRTAHGVGYAFAAEIARPATRPSAANCWLVLGARRIPLSDGENILGRDPSAAVFIDAAGVSRRHARISVDQRHVTLEDLDSKNGTRIRSTPVTTKTPLRDGDEIRVGPVLIIFHASASGMSTETIAQPRNTRE